MSNSSRDEFKERIYLPHLILTFADVHSTSVSTCVEAPTFNMRWRMSTCPGESCGTVRVIPAPSPEPREELPQLALDGDARREAETSATSDFSCELPRKQLVLGRVPDSEVPAAPRFHLQFVIEKSTHDKLCHAQVHLSHSVPAGDLAQVFDRALDALISQLDVRRLGVSTPNPVDSRSIIAYICTHNAY